MTLCRIPQDNLKHKRPVPCVSSQRRHPLHVGGGRGWRALGRRHCVAAHLRAAAAAANPEEEDTATPAAGERGGRGWRSFCLQKL